MDKIFDKLGGKLTKNLWGQALKYLGKTAAAYLLTQAIVDGIKGAEDLYKTLEDQITGLEDLKLNADGTIDWNSPENCARIENAGAIIGNQAAGLIKQGFGRKIFGRKRDKGKCKKPPNEPKTAKEHKECYKDIANLDKLNLSPEQLNTIEKALGNKGSYCAAGKYP